MRPFWRRSSWKASCAPAFPGGGFGGAELAGATIEGERRDGKTAQYEIASVVPDAPWLYELRDRDSGKPFCARDAQGKRLAIALAGRYDSTNTAQADASRITFACTSGVMAKCYRQGR